MRFCFFRTFVQTQIRMKKFVLLLITLLSVYSARSQDTIVKKNGDIVIAKVLEIGPTEIKYKRYDFQEGPMYIEIKSNLDKIIFSNGIKEVFPSAPPSPSNQVIINNNEPPRDYYNHPITASNKIERWGMQYRYHNERLNEKDMFEILNKTKDKKIVGLVAQAKDAKALQYIGFFGIPLGILSGIFLAKSTGMFYNSPYNNSYPNRNSDLTFSGLFLAGAITCPIVSGIQKAKRSTYTHDAIKLYNEKY